MTIRCAKLLARESKTGRQESRTDHYCGGNRRGNLNLARTQWVVYTQRYNPNIEGVRSNNKDLGLLGFTRFRWGLLGFVDYYRYYCRRVFGLGNQSNHYPQFIILVIGF